MILCNFISFHFLFLQVDSVQMGVCWNHTVTRTKQGSVGVIRAQREKFQEDDSWVEVKG